MPPIGAGLKSLYNLGMRLRLATTPLLLVLMFATACTMYRERPAQNFSEATGAEAMERIFWKDIQAGNQVELGRMLASNYVGVTSSGPHDRDVVLEEYRKWKLNDFSIGDLRTELNGPTFVVTYTITLNGTSGNQPLRSTPQHAMSVWQHQKSGWVMIAHSVTQP